MKMEKRIENEEFQFSKHFLCEINQRQGNVNICLPFDCRNIRNQLESLDKAHF